MSEKASMFVSTDSWHRTNGSSGQNASTSKCSLTSKAESKSNTHSCSTITKNVESQAFSWTTTKKSESSDRGIKDKCTASSAVTRRGPAAAFESKSVVPLRGANKAIFPVTLHAILSNPEYEDIIEWLPHGRSWRILQQSKFENIVIPTFFRHGRYTSFARQVNGWGFQRLTDESSSDYNSYFHILFLRHEPQLCKKMKRLTRIDVQTKKYEARQISQTKKGCSSSHDKPPPGNPSETYRNEPTSSSSMINARHSSISYKERNRNSLDFGMNTEKARCRDLVHSKGAFSSTTGSGGMTQGNDHLQLRSRHAFLGAQHHHYMRGGGGCRSRIAPVSCSFPYLHVYDLTSNAQRVKLASLHSKSLLETLSEGRRSFDLNSHETRGPNSVSVKSAIELLESDLIDFDRRRLETLCRLQELDQGSNPTRTMGR